MYEVEVTPEQLKKAKKMAKEMGTLRNSITTGEGNVAGFLGEVIVADLTNATQSNTYDYDIIIPSGEKVDVKTKRTTVAPKDYYECSVAAFNTTQKCDLYAFVRVKNDYSKAWFLGMMPKKTYFDKAKFMKKGEIDPDNNFKVKADCYNMAISDIWTEFVNHFGEK